MKPKYVLGQKVYLIADPEQNAFIVIGIYITSNEITYTLRNSIKQDTFYDFEISKDKVYS